MFASLWPSPSSSKSFRDLDVSFILKGWNRFRSARGVIISRWFFHLHKGDKGSILKSIVGIYERLSFLKGKVGLLLFMNSFRLEGYGWFYSQFYAVSRVPPISFCFPCGLLVKYFIHLFILSIIFHLFCKKIRIAH